MESKLYEELKRLADVLHWLGKYRDASAITLVAVWLQLNEAGTLDDLSDLLENTNDNPNIVPLRAVKETRDG